MRAVHVIVRGAVQGVGFRLFVEREAQALGLDGWVRNRRDGTVETVISGDDGGVDRMLTALRLGPPASTVESLAVTVHTDAVPGGFRRLPTE